MRGIKSVIGFVIFTFLCQPLSFAQPTSSQTIGGVTQQEKAIETERGLQDQIGQEKASDKLAEPQDVTLPADSGPKVLITKINVEDATLLDAADVRKIVAPYEGTELSLKDAQKIANLISDQYRKKGYLTSRAYIPSQKIQDGVLLIRAIEGKVGSVEVRGNRYFSTRLLKNKLNLQPGSYFDYSAMQKALIAINEQPDRSAKAVVVPGQERGTTDIVMDVKDRLPVHVGVGYDNFGSRYINKSRYSMSVEHNNLTGHDDKAFLKFQTSEAHFMRLQQGRYSIPLNSTLEVGAYALASQLELGREFEDLDSRGKAKIMGLFFNKALVKGQGTDVSITGGYDHKSIVNFLSGSKTSRDELRVFKAGVEVDKSDSVGRSIFNAEYDYGVPGIFGGMAAKDPMASRAGSGAKFQKGLFNFYRLNPMPLSTLLLWKNSAQYTNHGLTAAEQFQVGGAASVRGYGPGEYAGDRGFFTSLELTLPIYGLSKGVKVPFHQEKLYDAWKMVTFWDFGYVSSKNPAAGEEKQNTIKGYGFGTHFNVKNLMLSFELGYPIGKTPADGHHAHPWVEATYKF